MTHTPHLCRRARPELRQHAHGIVDDGVSHRAQQTIFSGQHRNQIGIVLDKRLIICKELVVQRLSLLIDSGRQSLDRASCWHASKAQCIRRVQKDVMRQVAEALNPQYRPRQCCIRPRPRFIGKNTCVVNGDA